MVRRGHVPQRMCAGCGQRRDKSALVRLAARERGGYKVVELDPSAKGESRSVWVCPREACLDKVLKRKTLKQRLSAQEVAPTLAEDLRKYVRNIRDKRQ